MPITNDTARRRREARTIARAWEILESRAKYSRSAIDSPQAARDFIRLRLEGLEREEFWAIWLNCQHHVIEMESLFVGTLTQTSVYSREVVKRALALNAGAVIFAHNHPSGNAEPSEADIALTKYLKYALALVDISILDHLIAGKGVVMTSLAERRLL